MPENFDQPKAMFGLETQLNPEVLHDQETLVSQGQCPACECRTFPGRIRYEQQDHQDR